MNPNNSRHSTLFHSVLIIGAIAAAASLLSGCSIKAAVNYKNAGKYKAGNFEYNASDVSSVDINWISGSIVVKQSDSSALSVKEEDTGLKDKQKLHWYLDGDKLIIQYCKSGYHGSFFSVKKNLTVEVPAGINLDIDSVSSDVTVTNGKKFGKVNLDTVSGDADLEIKECGSLDADTVSGDVRLDIEKCDKISVNSVSGDVTFRSLPSDGAEISFSKVSGSLKTDKNYEMNGKKYVFGGGKCSVSIDTVSGDLTVE